MHLHFLGICGTFMGSLAILAREAGHEVSGSDRQVYPPMSDQLAAAGIQLHQGFDYDPQDFQPDLVIVGNVMRRGLPCVEALLNSSLPYTSGPQWLHDEVLRGRQAEPRWVLAVAGTHGKTTTASMLAWLLEAAGMQPGFLIGGVPGNFPVSARLGANPFFVIEADEYDTAFFDKRSKFVHYAPRTLVMNNLEFDHADIFADLAAIQTQFHHLLRILPEQGKVIYPAGDAALQQVLARGCWSESESLGLQKGDWQAEKLAADASHFLVSLQGEKLGEVRWNLTGDHNIYNALAALAAARHVGVRPQAALASLAEFKGVKRRMEKLGEVRGIQVFDDFAHHPTAIATTLQGIRPRCQGRLLAVIEPRSNTMQLGTLRAALVESVKAADQVFWFQGKEMSWSPAELNSGENFTDLEALCQAVAKEAKAGDYLVLMSNGSFGGLHQKLLARLAEENS
ncbi:UDP-N-acetylmuramate:L-alanyl-gamma-D-glutamyl-meso-diaminopimelate ligase [Marinospirillum sp.]|uniref:UDP-N-acetylmuramate:L-alanyl-gamma-D-glutamyl- meso-diaminopimelate ligase n=1 Tax=Marinospirillum sp. TaxID=2183934 RepID=UPI002870A1F1|nr:UDP-N-acetylmuramate:L-alanyl-gamma-D-glutamyl-meso-diaminopimelate ligase [Marinospirillum sp.]MDR9468433.1 UDP-N-acetylmuramate:L-alanyl-gamma-D-glutamyl-meso-diaminopimelate ligase [Marinospirillum sp.]